MKLFDKITKHIKFPELIIYLVTLFGIGALIYCAFFVYPSGDDTGYAYRIQRDGLFKSFIDTYISWSGRYAATFISFINPILLGHESLFTPYSIFTIIALFFCLYFFIHQALYEKTIHAKLLTTSLIFCTILAGMPSIFEAFYWFSAYISYLIPLDLTLLLIGLIIYRQRNIERLSTIVKAIILIVSILFVIFIVGCNELTLILIDCIIAFLFLTKARNQIGTKFLISLLITAFVSSIVMLAAPGNFSRYVVCNVPINLLHTFVYSTSFTILFLVKNIPLLAAMSVVYMFIVAPNLGERKSTPNISPLWIAILGCSIIWFIHTFLFLSTDTRPLGRTENVPFITLVISWFIVLYYRTPNNIITFVRTKQNPLLSTLTIFLFLFFMFRFESPLNATIADIVSGNVSQFAKERQEQIDIQKSSKTQKTIIPTLTVAPTTLTYTIFDNTSKLNSVISPGEPIYGTQPIFINDTIQVQDSRVVWNKIKQDLKQRIQGE